MERSGLLIRQTCFLQKVQPNLAASQSQLVELARRLADWPNHAEIPNGRTTGRRISFENRDFAARFRRDISVSKTNNSCTYDGNICLFVCHVFKVAQASTAIIANRRYNSMKGQPAEMALIREGRDRFHDFAKVADDRAHQFAEIGHAHVNHVAVRARIESNEFTVGDATV